MLNLKDTILRDYKESVGECVYYTEKSGYKDEEIDIIKKDFKIKFLENYEEYIKQFYNLGIDELSDILHILNIEADNEWTNANRCEATALLLKNYLRNVNKKNSG